MSGLIALIVAIILCVLTLNIVFFVGGILLALAAAVVVNFVAEKLIGQGAIVRAHRHLLITPGMIRGRACRAAKEEMRPSLGSRDAGTFLLDVGRA